MKKDEMMIFNVRIRKDLHKRLKMDAVEKERSIQEIIKELIEVYLEIEEERLM
jgi:predicted HicB family RNase H-like nuclease